MTALALLLSAALTMSPQGGSAAQRVNTRCPVTGRDVTNHQLYHHVTVRNHSYYVYDREAAVRLRQSPDSFLMKDGTPLVEAEPGPSAK